MRGCTSLRETERGRKTVGEEEELMSVAAVVRTLDCYTESEGASNADEDACN